MLNEKERKMQSGLYSVLLLMLYVTHLERHKEAPSSGCVLEENGARLQSHHPTRRL